MTTVKVAIVLTVIVLIPVTFFILFRMVRKQLGVEAARQWMKESRRAYIIAGVCIIPSVCVGLFGSPLSLRLFVVACVVFSIVLLLGALAVSIWRGRRGGALLGRIDMDFKLLKLLPWFSVAALLLASLLTVTAWQTSGRNDRIMYYDIDAMMVLMLIVTYISRRVELRENGIRVLGEWLPWNKVRSYLWEGVDKNALRLVRMKPRWFHPSYLIVIKPDQRDGVEKIVSERVKTALES